MPPSSKFSKGALLIIVPIALAGMSYAWNPLGFYSPQHDESIYLRRAMSRINWTWTAGAIFHWIRPPIFWPNLSCLCPTDFRLSKFFAPRNRRPSFNPNAILCTSCSSGYSCGIFDTILIFEIA